MTTNRRQKLHQPSHRARLPHLAQPWKQCQVKLLEQLRLLRLQVVPQPYTMTLGTGDAASGGLTTHSGTSHSRLPQT